MTQMLHERCESLSALCAKHDVARLEVFGSAATGDFDPLHSDIDFLVLFRRTPALTPADQYFGLLEDLVRLFGHRIDLVEAGAVRNTYFIKRLNESRQVLYAA